MLLVACTSHRTSMAGVPSVESLIAVRTYFDVALAFAEKWPPPPTETAVEVGWENTSAVCKANAGTYVLTHSASDMPTGWPSITSLSKAVDVTRFLMCVMLAWNAVLDGGV